MRDGPVSSFPELWAILKFTLPLEVFNYTSSFYGMHSAATPDLELRRICSARATHGRKTLPLPSRVTIATRRIYYTLYPVLKGGITDNGEKIKAHTRGPPISASI